MNSRDLLSQRILRPLFTASLLSFAPITALAENPGAVGQPFGFGLELAQADFEIPAVVDRPDPFDLQAGPTLTIKRIEAYELDVSGTAPRRTRITDGGFSDIVNDYMARQEGKFTFGVLQELANQLTGYLRQQGNLLANVYIPSQDVQDGIVRLDVLMGTLGAVEVRGNSSFKETHVRKAFAAAEGEKVNREQIEESMLILQEYPGLSAGGTFMPGQQLGETRLVINVNEEDRFVPQFLADNYGSDSTGRNRYGAHFELNNPLSLLDKLTVDVVLVDKPDDAETEDDFDQRLYGGLRYEMSPWDSRWGIGFEFTANNYVVGNAEGQEIPLAAFQVSGESQSGRLFMTHKLHRSRASKIDLEFGLTVEDAKTRFGGTVGNEDDLTYLDLILNYQLNDDFFGGGVNFVNVRLVRGLKDVLGSLENGSVPRQIPTSRSVRVPAVQVGCLNALDNGCVPNLTPETQRFIDGDFFKVEYNVLRFQRLKYFNALLSVSGQETQDPLAAVQESGIGGPYNVRAYPTGSFLADRTLFASIEFIRPMFENRFQVSAFYDFGNGKNFLPLLDEPEEVSLHGLGIGMRWQFNEHVNMNLTAAWARGPDRDVLINGENGPNGRIFGRDAPGRDEPMVYFSFLLGL